MSEIDVRGLSCPEPVLIVMDEMDKHPGVKLTVLSDAAHTRDNIVKLAKDLKDSRLLIPRLCGMCWECMWWDLQPCWPEAVR